MCSMAGSCGFRIFSQHGEASDGVPPQSCASESEKVLDGTQKTLLCESVIRFLRMLVHLFIAALLSTRRTEDQRAFSVGPRGMSQASLILLAVCFPLSFSPCVVSFYTLTLWSSAPGMPSLFLENSSGSTHHPIGGSNRFSITALKCSVVFLHLKTQSENHTVKKNHSRSQYYSC